MSDIANFVPKWATPETIGDVSHLAESLMISKAHLAQVIGVPISELLQKKLSESTKVHLQPLVDVYNRAIWMAKDEKKAACWMNHGYPRGMGKGSPLHWIRKGDSEYVKNVQDTVYAGVHA